MTPALGLWCQVGTCMRKHHNMFYSISQKVAACEFDSCWPQVYLTVHVEARSPRSFFRAS
jgi:hypothetical protein